MTANISSTAQVSFAHIDTIVWQSTSSGPVNGASGSMSRFAMASASTAASRKSWAWVG